MSALITGATDHAEEEVKRIIALGSAIAAAGALSWLGVAASAAPAARPAVSGTEHFQVVGTSATSNTASVIATGVFTAGGVDHTGARADTLVFPNGSFKVAHKGTTTHSFNPKTCLLTVSGHSALTLYGGIEATRRILAANPQIRILVVTMFDDDASVFTAMKAGARGYVLKDADKPDMLRAITAVGNGEAIFSPGVASRVLDYFTAPRPAQAAAAFPELTQREREILNLIAQGHGNQDIARRLVLTHSTVRNYVSSIFSKLQVADRAHAIVRARQAGLG